MVEDSGDGGMDSGADCGMDSVGMVVGMLVVEWMVIVVVVWMVLVVWMVAGGEGWWGMVGVSMVVWHCVGDGGSMV